MKTYKTMALVVVPLLFLVMTNRTSAAVSGEVTPSANRPSDERAAILECLDEYWKTEPFPAARGRCIDGWKFCLLLGDESMRECLRGIQNADKKHVFAASSALLLADEQKEVDYWRNIAQDTSLTPEKRLRSLIVCSTFSEFRVKTLPPEIDAVCRKALRVSAPSQHLSVLQALRDVSFSTETGQCLVDYISDQTLRWERGQQIPKSEECLIDWSVTSLDNSYVLKKRGTTDVLRRLLRVAPWTSVRDSAAIQLMAANKSEPARQYLLSELSKETDQGRRVFLAGHLVEMGDETFREELLKAMAHTEQRVRHKAYLAFLELKDPVFIDHALNDLKPSGRSVGYSTFGPLSLSRHLDMPSHDTRRKLAYDYLTALYQKGTSNDAKNRSLGIFLMYEDAPITGILPSLRLVLEKPLPPPPRVRVSPKETVAAYYLHTTELACLLRAGTNSDRLKALERLKTMYETPGNDEVALTFLRTLGTTLCEKVQPLLFEAVQDGKPTHNAQIRLTAAVGWLAIEAGRIDL